MVLPLVATAPWWLGPAITTAGVGSIMLHDYIKKRGMFSPGISTSNSALDIDNYPEIQWKDTNKENNVVVEPNLVDNSISRFVPAVKEEVKPYL